MGTGGHMKAIKTIVAILGLLVVAPIWYYLVYQLLLRTHATELMWFLYWVYLPVGILTSILTKIIDAEK
jgi:hypothetical protein